MNRRFESVSAVFSAASATAASATAASTASSASSSRAADDGVADVVVGRPNLHGDRLQRGMEMNCVPLNPVSDEVVVMTP